MVSVRSENILFSWFRDDLKIFLFLSKFWSGHVFSCQSTDETVPIAAEMLANRKEFRETEDDIQISWK